MYTHGNLFGMQTGGILIIGIIIWFFYRLYMKSNNQFQKKETPLQILEKRFAHGEITQKEFEEARRILEDTK